ncbi:MAG TPA: hypothetical protein VJ623_14685 [Holophagaceae bacterium]|nr:hypothetical protein [Holophagaceae bacterium]
MSLHRLTPLLAMVLLACQTEAPRRVENTNLGVAATFPGEPRLSKVMETTPFGEVQWFDLTCAPGGRLDESFSISVGNLPKGKQGGSTPGEILATMEGWLKFRLSGITRTDLPAAQGPGFRYEAKHASGHTIEGVVILRRGRIHHAQATVRKANDGRLRAFIDGFEVAP